MEFWINNLYTEIANTSTTESLAVVFSVLYLVFAAKESLWCWLFALLSVVFYTLILYRVNLWAETLLQLYYGAMAVYGYISWKGKKNRASLKLEVSKTSFKQHVFLLSIISGGTLALGLALSYFTSAEMPFIDSFTTVGALTATWMVTQKKLENWIYWIIIDGVSIYLYSAKSLHLSSLLFLFYTLTAIWGYFNWLSIYRKQSDQLITA